MNGFTKTPNNLPFKKVNHWGIYIILLTRANFRDSKVNKGKLKGLEVKRGCCLISILKLMELTSLGKMTILKTLKELKEDNKIEILSVRGRYSMFKIVDYGKFQGELIDFKENFSFEKKLEKVLSLGVSLKNLPSDITFSYGQYEKIREIGLKEINRRWGIPNEKRKLISELRS